MAKHEQLYAGPDGWSPWRWPVLKGYRLTCCDCGLVHDIEVLVHKVENQRRDGLRFTSHSKPVKNHRIRWRFRTNYRATAQVRRHMKDSA